jgi:hypothetical protein
LDRFLGFLNFKNSGSAVVAWGRRGKDDRKQNVMAPLDVTNGVADTNGAP